MELIQGQQSPLFGRLTGQWHLRELPFSALAAFFPHWSVEERIAAYAVVGGVPAYLEWLDPDLGLSDNIRQEILAPGSLFSAEPTLLLYDELREPMVHLAILRAIGAGAHTLDEIANATLVGKSHLSAYLQRLQELRLVERRLPATVPPAERLRSRRGRYHLADPYFRFYFRFMAHAHEQPGVSRDQAWVAIQQDLRAFVGQTAFEDLCRRWVLEQAQVGRLTLAPEIVGSHWSRGVQADVVAVSWRDKAVLIGECKWGVERVDRATIRDLLDRTGPRTLADLPGGGANWAVTYACFARGGFTPAAAAALAARNGLAVDAARLAAELC
jgi:AAA+ ATPase superfamily predicted ATPase